ncbi:Protein of unknown function [Gryllus bimaculatus]|nr:Protein of unknown function [Gryllus bimaculatus]
MRVLVTRVAALLCCALFLLSDVSCVVIKKHQCAERQILKTLDLPEFFKDKYCRIETQERSLRKTNCTLWDFAEEDGYHDCTDLQFSTSLSSNVLGTEILPYKEAYPNFVINFKDIKWNYMQYRLQVAKSQKCHRVWFDPSSEREALSISFACKQLGTWWAGGLDAELLVDVGLAPSDITAHAHYVLKVPLEDPNESISLKDWSIVVAVDIAHKPNLIVQWPTVPDKYNVSEYHVRINKSVPKCFMFFIVDVAETWVPLYFTLPAVLVPLVLILFLIFSVYYFCCTPPREPPKVLLLFEGTTQEHYLVVCKLFKYLKEFCGVNCLMGDEEIPESEEGILWAVATPVVPPASVAISYCAQNVRKFFLGNKSHALFVTYYQVGEIGSDRFLVAVPPYCTEENIPLCLKNVPRFYIPAELKWLLWFLYNRRCRKSPFMWMAKAYLRTCWCPGPMSTYHLHGTQLKENLELADTLNKLAKKRISEGTESVPGTILGGPTTESIPPYPGNVRYYMLRGREGSQISQSDVVSMNSTDVNSMADEYTSHDITEEGGSEDYKIMFSAGNSPFSDTLTFKKFFFLEEGLEGSLARQNNVISNIHVDTLAL